MDTGAASHSSPGQFLVCAPRRPPRAMVPQDQMQRVELLERHPPPGPVLVARPFPPPAPCSWAALCRGAGMQGVRDHGSSPARAAGHGCAPCTPKHPAHGVLFPAVCLQDRVHPKVLYGLEGDPVKALLFLSCVSSDKSWQLFRALVFLPVK